MLAPKIAEQIEIDAKYDVYLSRQAADIAAYRRDESFALPDELDYAALPGLSNEVKQKLTAHRPRTIGHAGRIDGMTPAALTLLVAHVKRGRGKAAEARLSKTAQRRSTTARALSSSRLFHVKRKMRLSIFVALLLAWQRKINLVAASTLPQIWTRHVADSLQLLTAGAAGQGLGRLRIGRRISRPADRLRAGRDARRQGPSGGKQRQEGRVFARGRSQDRGAGAGPSDAGEKILRNPVQKPSKWSRRGRSRH